MSLANINAKAFNFPPGAKLLVTCEGLLNQMQRDRVRKMVERWAGDAVEVLVIDSSMKIELLDGPE